MFGIVLEDYEQFKL